MKLNTKMFIKTVAVMIVCQTILILVGIGVHWIGGGVIERGEALKTIVTVSLIVPFTAWLFIMPITCLRED